MQFRHVTALAAAAALLAACNSSEDAETEEVAQPEPVLTQNPVPTAAPDGTALVPGTWDVTEDSNGAHAYYGQEGTDPQMVIACNAATKVVTISMTADEGEQQAWRVDAGGEAARLDMEAGENGQMRADIDPSLAIFHAFAQPGQVVALTSPSGQRLQFPTYPGIQRVLYACS